MSARSIRVRATDALRARRAACPGRSARRPTSRSPIAPRCSARWPPSRCASRATCTPPTPTPRSRPCARSGALVEVREDAVVVRGTGLREAREPAGPIDVGNAGTLLRLLPGLAGRPGRPLASRSTATTRSAAGRSTGSPSRCARWAPSCRPASGASRRCRCTARGCARSPTSCRRQRPGQVVRAAGGARGGRRDDRGRARAQPRPHRADAAGRAASASTATAAT